LQVNAADIGRIVLVPDIITEGRHAVASAWGRAVVPARHPAATALCLRLLSFVFFAASYEAVGYRQRALRLRHRG